MEGPRGTDQDQGQKAGPTVRWDIPNVLVKDVPNFELLSPELEAGTAPSHSSLHAHICQALTKCQVWLGAFSALLTATYFISGETEALREGTQQLFLSAIRVLSPSLCLGKTGLCPDHNEAHLAGGIPETLQWELPAKDRRMRVWAEVITWARKGLRTGEVELVGL